MRFYKLITGNIESFATQLEQGVSQEGNPIEINAIGTTNESTGVKIINFEEVDGSGNIIDGGAVFANFTTPTDGSEPLFKHGLFISKNDLVIVFPNGKTVIEDENGFLKLV